jgi:hypothetical protein
MAWGSLVCLVFPCAFAVVHKFAFALILQLNSIGPFFAPLLLNPFLCPLYANNKKGKTKQTNKQTQQQEQ